MGDIALAEALLDHLAAEGCIDMGRVVLVGHSKGGGLADAVACHLADRVIGVVLAAAIQFGIPCQPSRPLPIVAFHAVNDPILPYEGGPVRGAPRAYPEVIGVEEAMSAWATRDGCTGGPVTTELPDGGAVLTWNGCLAPVVLQRLARGGHRYPAMATQVVRDMIRGSAPGGAPGG